MDAQRKSMDRWLGDGGMAIIAALGGSQEDLVAIFDVCATVVDMELGGIASRRTCGWSGCDVVSRECRHRNHLDN